VDSAKIRSAISEAEEDEKTAEGQFKEAAEGIVEVLAALLPEHVDRRMEAAIRSAAEKYNRLGQDEKRQLKAGVAKIKENAAAAVRETFQERFDFDLHERELSSPYRGRDTSPPSLRECFWALPKSLGDLLEPYGIALGHLPSSQNDEQKRKYPHSFFLDGWPDEFAAAHEAYVQAMTRRRDTSMKIAKLKRGLAEAIAMESWTS